MKVTNVKDHDKSKIESFPYKDKVYEVKSVWVQWLSQAGPPGSPEYGLRFFTVGPKGEIPIHKHLYYQTMYILNGKLIAYSYDSETDRKIDETPIGPNDLVFIPTMEPHGFVNPSDHEDCTFLCCIANVYEEDQ